VLSTPTSPWPIGADSPRMSALGNRFGHYFGEVVAKGFAFGTTSPK
jgi:hypothetical protein